MILSVVYFLLFFVHNLCKGVCDAVRKLLIVTLIISIVLLKIIIPTDLLNLRLLIPSSIIFLILSQHYISNTYLFSKAMILIGETFGLFGYTKKIAKTK